VAVVVQTDTEHDCLAFFLLGRVPWIQAKCGYAHGQACDGCPLQNSNYSHCMSVSKLLVSNQKSIVLAGL
jgi:hypothetical protein